METKPNKAFQTLSVEEITKQIQAIDPVKTSWDDKGLSTVFANIFLNEVRYNSTAKSWYYYDGRVWKIDNEAVVTSERCKHFHDALLKYAFTIQDEKIRGDYYKFILKYGSYNSRQNIIKDAKSVNAFSAEDLDANANLFNCQNGTFNLKTFEFVPHNPGDLLSKISNVVYNPDAPDNHIREFISEILINSEGNPDEDKIDYLQKALGYALTAETTKEAMFFLYGPSTRNGKSTLMETVYFMLGETDGYGRVTAPEVLEDQKHRSGAPTEELAVLKGVRFLNASEPPKNMILDGARFKLLTGADTISARFLHGHMMEFKPVFKLFINTNHLPVVADETVFKSGRVNVIVFPRHFSENERDGDLKQKLRSEENISAMFNWCIAGLKRFRETGLIPPDSVVTATKEYRDNSDKLQLFFSECYQPSTNNISAADVYGRYKYWCDDEGFGKETKGQFFRILKEKKLLQPIGTVKGKTVKNILLNLEPI